MDQAQGIDHPQLLLKRHEGCRLRLGKACDKAPADVDDTCLVHGVHPHGHPVGPAHIQCGQDPLSPVHLTLSSVTTDLSRPPSHGRRCCPLVLLHLAAERCPLGGMVCGSGSLLGSEGAGMLVIRFMRSILASGRYRCRTADFLHGEPCRNAGDLCRARSRSQPLS